MIRDVRGFCKVSVAPTAYTVTRYCDPPHPPPPANVHVHSRTDRLRCADDKLNKNGTNPHGPSDPGATSNTVKTDYLKFCLAAKRNGAVPTGWGWGMFLKATAPLVWQPMTEADATTRWGWVRRQRSAKQMLTVIYYYLETCLLLCPKCQLTL